jgi:dTDP-4-amino-4,6-dideoxygalactose transaminase
LIDTLQARGIGLSVHYKPLHRMTYYRERYHLNPEDYHTAERIWKGTFSLPVFPCMTEEELEYVVENVLMVIQ